MQNRHNMSDYTFMKTGQDVNAQTDSVPEHIKTRALALIATWTIEALADALTYCTHAKRDVLLLDDVQLSMKHQAMTFLSRSDMEDKVLEAEATLETLFESDDEDEDQLHDDCEGTEIWTASTCACVTCSNLNAASGLFDAWDPVDPAEKVLKSALKEQENTRKMTIS